MRQINFKSQARWLIECPAFWICVLAFILLFTLISNQEFWSGYDTYFHMNSIYEDAMQIKTGHYSYFISLFGFERSGRIVNSLYGPIFNYLLGAILLLCKSWIRFEFVIFFITLVICGSAMYSCARALRISKATSRIIALFYMISPPILILWVRNFEFTGLGAAVLLPFILMVGIKILKSGQIKVMPLAVMMAVCLQIHLMTSLIAGLVLIPFFICGLILSDHRMQMIKKGCLAALISFCLSGNIFGAIYDVYSTNHLIPTFPNFHLQQPIVNKALFVQGHRIVGMGAFYTLLIIVTTLGIFLYYRSVTTIDWCLLFEDIFFLWLSSAYFPWESLLKSCPELASIIQFPIRFASITFVTTLLLLGRIVSSLTINPRRVINVILTIAFLVMLYSSFSIVTQESQNWQSNNVIQYWVHPSKNGGYSRDFHNGKKIRDAFRSSDLSSGVNVVHKITTDYMPTSARVTLQNYYHNPFNQVYIKLFRNQYRFHKSTRDHMLLMTWQSPKRQKMQVPLVKYGRTVATLNHHVIHPKRTLIGTMVVNTRSGINQMQIRYRPSKIFKALIFISILSWLIVIVNTICRKVKSL